MRRGYRRTVAGRRVAIINDTSSYVGPVMARNLAERGHDLVIGDPHDGLVASLEALGVDVEVAAGVRDIAAEATAPRLVQAALDRFGRLDAAVAFTGRIVTGRF